MKTERDLVIEKIIYHIEGNGAFSKLKNCNYDEKDWIDFRENFKKLKRFWGDATVVEKLVIKTIFDFERKFENQIEKCFSDKKITLSFLLFGSGIKVHLEDFALFREELERINSKQIKAQHPIFLFNKDELSEEEAEKAICYHGSEYGAWWYLRSDRKYVPECWSELIFAIRELKKYWKNKKMISRWVAASLTDLPRLVEGHVDIFKIDYPGSNDIKLLEEMTGLLIFEINELLSD